MTRMDRRALLAMLAVAAVALAGCSGGGKKDSASPSDDDLRDLPMLHGYVVDPAIRPLGGVTVKVLDTNASVESDDSGYFGLDDLPTEQFLVLVASKAGFLPQSKQVTLLPDTPVRLNFTLAPEPIKAASVAVLEFEGLLGCEVATIGPTGNNSFQCNAGTENRDRWDFSVEPDLAGAVIEVFWDPSQPAGQTMGMRLETLELGQLNVVLGEVVGGSPLHITVPQSAATKYYPQGGLMRLTMYAASDAEQNEAGTGYSIQAQQQVNAYASLFYIDPPPQGYTIDV